MFQEVLFWSEFPEQIDWEKLNVLLKGKQCRIFFASKSKREFLSYKKRVTIPSVKIGVWPVLSLEEGYWFSAFMNPRSLKKLEEFRGIPMKIDIEPPFPKKKYSFCSMLSWLQEYILMRSPPFRKEFHAVIRSLANDGEVILSGFALPTLFREQYGDPVHEQYKRNFIFYSTFHLPFLRCYYRLFFLYHRNEYFALGLANHGIFGNEPEYRSIKEFARDVHWAKKMGIKKIVIYSIEGILKRKDAASWLRIVFS